jgi:hypothetical protein
MRRASDGLAGRRNENGFLNPDRSNLQLLSQFGLSIFDRVRSQSESIGALLEPKAR